MFALFLLGELENMKCLKDGLLCKNILQSLEVNFDKYIRAEYIALHKGANLQQRRLRLINLGKMYFLSLIIRVFKSRLFRVVYVKVGFFGYIEVFKKNTCVSYYQCYHALFNIFYFRFR